ncbi:MAG TPA: TolC family protein [Terriglobales bacterium]|nr:TolC family protein [Terriglobales bacterium]
MNLQFGRLSILVLMLSIATSVTAQDKSSQPETKPLAFRTAIELALKNSATIGINRNDLQRAQAAVSQTRDFFLPQMVIGSGLGFSYGFPLSLEGAAPSVFNVNLQEGFFNLAQREYIRAAKDDVKATEAQNADRRNGVIMETALSYMQLDLLDSSIPVQREQQQAAARLQEIVNQRVQAGLDSSVDLTRAKLAVARTRLDIAQAQSAADQLRLRLSQLTGLPERAIVTSTETIPKVPEFSQDQNLASEAVDKNLAVAVANFVAESKEHRAKGEHKQLFPSIDLAAQYAVLARFNNYDQFFLKFQRHNVTAGASFRFYFLNPTQRAAADVARFDAQKAREEARNVKQQVSSDTLKLQRSVEQLTAARDVAQLEHELAQADIEAAEAKIQSGEATLKDQQNARVTEHERYTAYLNSTFELDKAQVQLLRQLNQLESWAVGPPR